MVVVVILIVFLLNVLQKEVRSFFYSFSAPIQKVLWKAGKSTSDFFQGIVRVKILKQELDELKLQNQELLSQIIVLKSFEKENKTLRQALRIELQKDFKLALSQIISKDISQDFILIDKGAKDDIVEGMSVITEQRVLIGRISEVYEDFSKVMLIFHKESSFDVKISAYGGPVEDGQEKDISGVVKGQGSSKVLLDFVPREENLSQGDIVVTSALGGIFPKGLLVGRIKEIKKNDVDPFQQAEIELFFDISQSEILFIILDF